MDRVRCAICGSENSEPFCSAESPDGNFTVIFNLVKCADCGLVYLNPRPDIKEMSRFYPEEYYKKPSPAGKGIPNAIIAFFIYLRKKRVCKYKTSGKILDLGCGSGGFLVSMQDRNWETFGVETSESGLRLCLEKKLNVRGDMNFPDGYFDVVTLWHSMEHMENPVSALRDIRRVLSGDGILLVSVPNIESMEYRLFKRFWFHLDLPRHVCHFSPATLENLLKKTGFKILKTSHYSMEYNPYGLIQSIMNVFTPEFNFLYKIMKRNQSPGGNFILNAAISLAIMGIFAVPAFCFCYVFSLFKLGGVIHVYAEKTD